MAIFINPHGAGCACARAECTDDCSVYKRYKPEPKPITKADRIRAMTDEELALFITGVMISTSAKYCDVRSAVMRGEIESWLKQEVSTDG